MKTMTRILAGLLLAFLTVGPAVAATITIVNVDGANEGFNDPTPAAPVGGNPAATVGAQRLATFQHAADLWGALLTSDVEIFVSAAFNPLACNATQAVLGSAGTIFVFRDFPNAEFPGTWYGAALADRRAGFDLNPGFFDINAQFNSSLNGNPACLGGRGWYYGFDGNEGLNIELLPVVLHELGHGLNFQTFVSRTTGNEFQGFQDIYEHYLRDNNLGLRWPQLTSAQRLASITSVNALSWDGPQVFAETPNFLGPRQIVRVTTPPLGDLGFGTASFGAPVGATTISGELVLVNDGVAPTSDGCTPFVNSVAGKIALIDRGVCTFVAKAAAAQAAGAIAVVIANNAPGSAPGLGGTDPSITIPVVSVSQANGVLLKANLPGVQMTIGSDPTLMAGADNAGRPLMYAPNPSESGSSTSHWDISAFPDLLMEPAINTSLSSSVDLTLAHFIDVGWNLPPDCSGAVGSIAANWPPNHNLTPVSISGVTDPEGDAVTITVTDVTSDEAVDARGSGNTCPDGTIDGGQASVRVERSGNGDGRVYRISFTATDVYGHSCTGSVSVSVPHDEGGSSVDSGQLFSAGGPCKGNGKNKDVEAVAATLDLRFVSMKAGTAVFEYSLPAEAEVSLAVFDVAGRKIADLADGVRSAGTHSVSWNPGSLGHGVYFYRLRTNEGTITRSALHIN